MFLLIFNIFTVINKDIPVGTTTEINGCIILEKVSGH